LDSSNWSPIAELPKEYHDTGVKLSINYDYKVNTNGEETYIMAPFSEYLIKLDKDTKWLSDLDNPLKNSLKKHNSETIDITQERNKLDSVPHFIIDFFFNNNSLYTIISIPRDKNGHIYLHNYSLNGEYIKKKLLHEGVNSASVSYSNMNKKLYKIYLENDGWYYEEINFD
jgi:hypothetical protein